jgi:hypothetical protein
VITPVEQRQYADVLLGKVRVAIETGKRKKADYWTRRYLNSGAAKRMAVNEAYRSIKPHRRPDKSILLSIAQKIDPWQGTTEDVIVHLKPKKSNPNDYRPIMDFGIENRALQHLVFPVLRELVQLHPRQYGTRGGTHAAIKQAVAALSSGFVWAVEVDIKDCYKSFDGKKLTSLIPLPKEVSERTLISMYLSMKGGNIIDAFGPVGAEWSWKFNFDEALADARQGIPQGSAVSPLVAEAMLAVPLYNLPQAGQIVAYADNILLLAKTYDDAVSMKKALWSALEAHPVGRLWPKANVFEAGQPIEFLGHQLTRRLNGMVDIQPTQANLDRFQNTLGNGLRRLMKQGKTVDVRLREAAGLRRYVRGWSDAFKLCPSVVDLKKRAFKHIAIARDFWD